MLPSRARAMSLATLLALAGLGALAAPAHAAPPRATIQIDTEEISLFEPLEISGTCPAGSRSAALSVMQWDEFSQRDTIVAEGGTSVGKAGDFEASLDLWVTDPEAHSAWPGDAELSVACFAYDSKEPLAEASTTFTIPEPEVPFDEIDVEMSSRTVALGSMFTVSATCPEGSTVGAVLGFNEAADEIWDAEEPFLLKEVDLDSNSELSLRLPLEATEGIEPELGPATVVVVCGEDFALMSKAAGRAKVAAKAAAPMAAAPVAAADIFPTAVGWTEFTITPAAAPAQPTTPSTAPGTVTVPARSAVPAQPAAASPTESSLANTGSEPAPLAAIALALIAAGGVAIRKARRA